jgi:hypothetical protein
MQLWDETTKILHNPHNAKNALCGRFFALEPVGMVMQCLFVPDVLRASAKSAGMTKIGLYHNNFRYSKERDTP